MEGLRAPVAVARDATGIVHIFATNEEDLALAQGLPGGVSGAVTSPFFNNLLGPWLTNETFRWRQLPLGGVR
jgi:acyl-homoserine lactone acylase PvdQ